MPTLKRVYLPLFLFSIALLSLAGFYFAGDSFRGHLINSDSLYLPVLFQDVLGHHGKMSSWYLTPAPYFFPDYLIYLAAYLSTKNIFIQILVFALLQISATLGAVRLLIGQLSDTNRLLSSVLSTVLLIWFAIHFGEPLALLLTSAHHYGVFLSSLVFVALWLRFQSVNYSLQAVGAVSGMCLLAFALSLSDTLFIVQVLAPFIGTSIVLDIVDGKVAIKRWAAALLPVGSGFLGAFSYDFFVAHSTRYSAIIGAEKVQDNLAETISFFTGVFSANPWYASIFFIYAVIVLYSGFLSLTRKLEGQARRAAWLVLFSLFSLLATVCALCLITNLPITPRYFIAVLFWPVIIVVFFGVRCLKSRFYTPAILLCLGVVIALSMDAFKLVSTNGMHTDYYPSEIACIDNVVSKEDLHNGIAQYWDAKYIQAFSKQDIRLAQYVDSLDEQRWITSESFYKEVYDFAVLSEYAPRPFQIRSQELIAINGAPSKTIVCGDRTLIIFEKNGLRIRR